MAEDGSSWQKIIIRTSKREELAVKHEKENREAFRSKVGAKRGMT